MNFKTECYLLFFFFLVQALDSFVSNNAANILLETKRPAYYPRPAIDEYVYMVWLCLCILWFQFIFENDNREVLEIEVAW